MADAMDQLSRQRLPEHHLVVPRAPEIADARFLGVAVAAIEIARPRKGIGAGGIGDQDARLVLAAAQGLFEMAGQQRARARALTRRQDGDGQHVPRPLGHRLGHRVAEPDHLAVPLAGQPQVAILAIAEKVVEHLGQDLGRKEIRRVEDGLHGRGILLLGLSDHHGVPVPFADPPCGPRHNVTVFRGIVTPAQSGVIDR